jgi:hypothetical protein
MMDFDPATIQRYKTTAGSLREERSRVREAAITAMDLLERFKDELVALRSHADFKDPVTTEPMVQFQMETDPARGTALDIIAFGGKYLAHLEIQYAYGDRLVSNAKCEVLLGDEHAGDFYRDVFRGSPLRLQKVNDRVILIRRLPMVNLTVREEAMDAGSWLCCFAETVLQHERLHG